MMFLNDYIWHSNNLVHELHDVSRQCVTLAFVYGPSC